MINVHACMHETLKGEFCSTAILLCGVQVLPTHVVQCSKTMLSSLDSVLHWLSSGQTECLAVYRHCKSVSSIILTNSLICTADILQAFWFFLFNNIDKTQKLWQQVLPLWLLCYSLALRTWLWLLNETAKTRNIYTHSLMSESKN